MDTEIDAKTFWKAIACRAIGVAIVTAKGADGPAGFLALSATHLTASPPMMMVSIGLTTSALAAVRESNHFAINYVPKGADALVKEFGGQGSLKGADRFLPGAWGELKTGAPTLVDSVGVDGNVVVRQVCSPDARVAGSAAELQPDDDFRLLHDALAVFLTIVRMAAAVPDHPDIVQVQLHALRVELDTRIARRGEYPAEVGIGCEERRLDEG